MNIITHALMGWCIGQRCSRQISEVTVVAAASVIPDVDALGAVVDLVRGGEAELFSAYHHKFGHCLPFCLFLLLVIHFIWKNGRLTLWFAAVFHLHLLCDIIGAKGPDGYQWPIFYFFPFSDQGIVWQHQWEINAWPNIVLTIWLLYLFFKQSAQAGYSPLSFISRSIDQKVVQTLQKRFKIDTENVE
jgi:membrane-bound metal-dependent hydrolase YbcI (DUF457 family)